jgi:hypothetical protein
VKYRDLQPGVQEGADRGEQEQQHDREVVRLARGETMIDLLTKPVEERKPGDRKRPDHEQPEHRAHAPAEAAELGQLARPVACA